MDDNDNKISGGGMFLIQDVGFQEVFTPEDFTSEHKDIARAIEDFIKGEIISRGEEIGMLNLERITAISNHRISDIPP